MINLNEEQQKVVNEQKKYYFLLASAGTGKTNTLAERVTSIIKMEIQSLQKFYVSLLPIRHVKR